MRKKIAIYIDYTIRIPNFIETYNSFKSELFSNLEEKDMNKNDIRLYWIKELKNSVVEDFYIKNSIPLDNYDIRKFGMLSFFYNEEHYKKFLEEYSFNLYVDCVVPNKNDLIVINTAQSKLFDIVLIDEVSSKRKVTNTLFFLSKNIVYPQSIIFLDKGQSINEENYFGIWNPQKDMKQINQNKNNDFLEWFIELEKKEKALNNE